MTGATTYSISLDDVDLALLPLRTHRFNEFLKKEHFQFQVIKKDNVEESPPTIFYKCHTCAIEVPAAFASEHRASIKHEANARIASEAALRTRALISALPPPSTEQPNTRFCANCSTTVGKNHDKTKEHRVAVMHDKLLWELMTAYVGDCSHDDVLSDDSDFNDTELQRMDKRETKGVITTGYTGIKKHEDNYSEIPKCDKKSVVNMENANDKKDDLTILEKLGEYEKKERKEKKTVSFNDDTELYVEVNCTQHQNLKPVEHNGEIFDVEFAEEHNDDIEVECNVNKASRKVENGNIESNNNITYPIGGVTKIGIEIENNTGNDRDIVTPQITKYTQTQNTIDYVEFITDNKLIKVNSDNYHSFIRSDNKIKCQVCSSTFRCEEADSHVFSVGHLNMIPITSINQYCVRKINNFYSHCILCNQKIKNANVAKHVITFAHARQATANTSDKSLNQKKTTKIDVKKPANPDMKLRTAVQNADKVNMQTKNVQEKANGAAGSGVTKKLDSKDTPSFLGENIASNSEVKPENAWPVIYPYEMVKDGCVRCVICDCKVPNHPDNRKSHLIGSNHAKNVAKRRLSRRNESTQSGVWRCEICECQMPNVRKYTRAHRCNLIVKKIQKLSHSNPESKEPTEPSVWRCPICECEMPNNRKSRRGHIFGHHVNNMEKIKTNVEN